MKRTIWCVTMDRRKQTLIYINIYSTFTNTCFPVLGMFSYVTIMLKGTHAGQMHLLTTQRNTRQREGEGDGRRDRQREDTHRACIKNKFHVFRNVPDNFKLYLFFGISLHSGNSNEVKHIKCNISKQTKCNTKRHNHDT